MINITINEKGAPSTNTITIGNEHENHDEVIQFTFPSDLEPLNKYAIAKTFRTDKRENVTLVIPLVNDSLTIGQSITSITGTWALYVMCKSTSGERVSISDPIVALVNANNIDMSIVGKTEIEPNLKIIYDELIDFKKELEQNEETRQANEETRANAENGRVSAETERANEEQARQENEAHRAENEVNRENAEEARANAETERISNEDTRKSNEALRVNAEGTRASAENERIKNEAERVSAESNRKQSETLREEAEGNRLSNEEKRSKAEKTRIQSEQERTSAEAERKNNEQSRINAESERATAETARAEAETTRINNEQSRVDNEALRVSAEAERVTAETARAEAEAKRDGVINGLKNSIDMKITKFYASNNGDTHIVDSDNGRFQDMLIYGKAEQVKTTGKNIFDFSKLVSDGIAVIDYNKQTITVPPKTNNVGYNQTLLDLCPNITPGVYSISMDCSNSEANKLIHFLETENDLVVGTPKELTDEDINAHVAFYNNIDSNNSNVISHFQIEQGSSATAYEPYKEQTLTLPITLNAVPVKDNGNVTIDGQQYVADYIDVEKGKIVRMTSRVDLRNVSGLTNLSYSTHSNGIGYLSYSIGDTSNKLAQKGIPPLSNNYIGSQWTNKSGYVYVPSVRSIIIVDERFTDKNTAVGLIQDTYIIYALVNPIEEDLTAEQAQALQALKAYYPTTNINIGSEQLEGYTVFNYPISMANGWNYVKKQLNDNRDYIYDIDMQSSEAYVNSEYVTVLTELGV